MYGSRLKSLRKEKNLTISELAKELNVSTSTYGGYESEHRKPPIDTLKKIAEYHGVSIDYILGLTDERDIKRLEKDASEYLKKTNLNWGGVPLSDKELKPIRDLFEVIVRDRLPYHKDKK